ncbi:MAG: helix-turn-helix domain-containing protein [Evtepia gabavorous]
MDYISVKDAAEKFKISERRIQKLCETNRIAGCTRISGIWLIPSDAVKPINELSLFQIRLNIYHSKKFAMNFLFYCNWAELD